MKDSLTFLNLLIWKLKTSPKIKVKRVAKWKINKLLKKMLA